MERTVEKNLKRYERKPNFDMRAKFSRDGRFWILERVETWILTVNYLAAISRNRALEKDRAASVDLDGKHKKKGKRDANGDGKGGCGGQGSKSAGGRLPGGGFENFTQVRRV